MAKADVVAAAVLAVQNGEAQVLNDQFSSVFDQGEASGNGPGFTQADIDAAVAAKGVQDQAAVDALSAQVSALQADDDSKTKIIAGIQALLSPPAQP